jgi:hypothetical protein
MKIVIYVTVFIAATLYDMAKYRLTAQAEHHHASAKTAIALRARNDHWPSNACEP